MISSRPGAGFDRDHPEGPAPATTNLLDRWVLARLDQVLVQVTKNLEDSDAYSAAWAVNAFLDDLTNWYVRRSRRRFWKSEHDADKSAAYATLYFVLVRLSRLLAPFTPYVSETIYQNLVRSVFPEAHLSVHHTLWPVPTGAAENGAGLLEEMALARQIASLGLGARNAANLKVRQPLSRALAYASGRQKLSDELAAIVRDELNVKSFEFVSEAGKLVTYRILPDNRLLGPRFGAQFPRLRAALAGLDPAQVAAAVQAGQPVQVELDGQAVQLAPGEVLVQTHPAEGLAVAADRLATVAVDTQLTPELQAEGLAREVVRRVQAMRKEAGFNIEDRIRTYYTTAGALAEVMVNWKATICAETLSLDLLAAPPPEGAYAEEHNLAGQTLRLAVVKA